MKRLFDMLFSLTVLVALSPLLLSVAVLIKFHSPGPILFRGVRVGRHGRLFKLSKFRTMVADADRVSRVVSTPSDDPRITRVGRILRHYNLDELPQFFDVLRGEMSVVGPRPEVPQYVMLFTEEEKEILSLRPGITDWASVWVGDKGQRLLGEAEPERVYMKEIRPEKLKLQLEYVRKHSMVTDMWIILKTFKTHILDRLLLPPLRPHRPAHPASKEQLRTFYRTTLRIRRAEERIADLVEAGEIGCPCHLCIGQEAIAAGVCAALTPADLVWGGHRSHGHYLAKGGDLAAMFAEVYGKVTGCSAGRGGSMHLFAPEVGILGTVPLVAATIPLAVGASLAAKLQGDRRVSVSFFGDGATEEGHFHESANLAALYRLPVVFVCENNFYASHMPLLQRRASDTIAQAGMAHGIPAAVVDGNDVTAVYEAAVDAVARARNGEGPTLLECRTYRWRGHVGPSWDMDVGVKRTDELKDWLPRDPVARVHQQLRGSGATDEELVAIEREIRDEIEAAVDAARRAPYPGGGSVLEHVYLTHAKGHSHENTFVRRCDP